MPALLRGKNFSHWRNTFPSPEGPARGGIQQGMGEFDTRQLVPILISCPNGAGLQISRGGRQVCGGNQRSTGYFEQNRRGKRQGTAHNHQSSPGRHVQSRGKFQQLPVIPILPPHKNGNCQWQTLPFSPFVLRPRCTQMSPLFQMKRAFVAHSGPNGMGSTSGPEVISLAILLRSS